VAIAPLTDANPFPGHDIGRRKLKLRQKTAFKLWTNVSGQGTLGRSVSEAL
jgi:hypothetical protein